MAEIDPILLEVLACPEDKGPLLYVARTGFYNPRLRRLYPIVDGIPVLLIDEGIAVSEAAQHEGYVAAGVETGPRQG